MVSTNELYGIYSCMVSTNETRDIITLNNRIVLVSIFKIFTILVLNKQEVT